MTLEAHSSGRLFARLLFASFALMLTAAMLRTDPATALPSYARQTGLACGACHTEFPQLTPFGRRFKIGGYTLGYATASVNGKPGYSPFPSKAPPADPTKEPVIGEWTPPVSVQVVSTFTHTATPMDTAGSAPYLKPNDNIEAVQSASLFYGGAITDHIGAFIQGTYNAQPFGPPVPHLYTWDNLDVRYANTTNIAGMPVVFGVSVNNNPTVQDPWNSTPAWGYPFVQTNLANTPGAKTRIDQGFAAQVLGATAYAFINDQLYIEGGGYQTLRPGTLDSLGVAPARTTPTQAIAPYFRAAFEQQWGKRI